MDNTDWHGGNTIIMHRVQELDRSPIAFLFDGHEVTGFEGDSILVAILARFPFLRKNEFSHQPRSGFCLMGACQECWVWNKQGERIRSCSTPLQAGMELFSTSPVIQGELAHES